MWAMVYVKHDMCSIWAMVYVKLGTMIEYEARHEIVTVTCLLSDIVLKKGAV